MSDHRARRAPLHPDISEALVETIVYRFYDRVRADAELGPIFAQAIGDDWDEHLGKMCDFWSSVTRMTGRYKGRPLPAHMRLKAIRPDHFETWLSLWKQTVSQETSGEAGAVFIGAAERIAGSMQAALFFRAADHAPQSSTGHGA